MILDMRAIVYIPGFAANLTLLTDIDGIARTYRKSINSRKDYADLEDKLKKSLGADVNFTRKIKIFTRKAGKKRKKLRRNRRWQKI